MEEEKEYFTWEPENKNNNASEIEKAVREYYNEVSRNWMRKKREEKYKEQVANYFPREELSSRLNKMPEEDSSEIEVERLNGLIYDILRSKNLITGSQRRVVYYNPVWANAIKEFMEEREYVKEGDKYVKKQK